MRLVILGCDKLFLGSKHLLCSFTVSSDSQLPTFLALDLSAYSNQEPPNHPSPDCPPAHQHSLLPAPVPSLCCSAKQHWCYRLHTAVLTYPLSLHASLPLTHATSCANPLLHFLSWERLQKSRQITHFITHLEDTMAQEGQRLC